MSTVIVLYNGEPYEISQEIFHGASIKIKTEKKNVVINQDMEKTINEFMKKIEERDEKHAKEIEKRDEKHAKEIENVNKALHNLRDDHDKLRGEYDEIINGSYMRDFTRSLSDYTKKILKVKSEDDFAKAVIGNKEFEKLLPINSVDTYVKFLQNSRKISGIVHHDDMSISDLVKAIYNYIPGKSSGVFTGTDEESHRMLAIDILRRLLKNNIVFKNLNIIEDISLNDAIKKYSK